MQSPMTFLQHLLAITLAATPFAAALAADHAPATRAARPAGGPLVYAWFPARFGTWNTDGIRWDLLTHICYRSVVLKADGTLQEPLGSADGAISSFVDTAHRHGVKVTVLVWGNTNKQSDSYLLNAPQVAADNLLAYVKAHNLDGVNIDDETFQERNQFSGQPNRPLVTAFFRTLSRTFKAANPDYHLSYAAPPVISPKDRFAASWLDLAAIAKEVDAIIPMGYELNPPSIGWTTNPGPLAGGGKVATTTTRDYQTMIDDYVAAMGGPQQKHKLLPGFSLALGGYEWRCRSDQPLAPILGKGVARSLEECQQAAAQHGRRWADRQASPWYVYQDGEAFIQGWYTDLEALHARMRWVRKQNLGGIGLWVLDGQAEPPERWTALEELLKP